MTTLARTVVRRSRRLVIAAVALVLLGIGAIVAVPVVLGFQTYAITTGSMAPTAPPGSLVVSEPVPVADLAVGDVITYLPPPDSGIEHLVTHRLTEIDVDADGDRLMRTQGDANVTADPWTFVLDGAVQPRMTRAVPMVGHAILAVSHPPTRMLLIGIPALLIGLGALREIVGVFREPIAADAAPSTPADEPDRIIDLSDATVDAAQPTHV